ncbi:hypothetical protein JG687_00008247 [Phytophthora cactorum]|uniref:ZSWIM1/3 RNaseH-like domain-containing protein n=1 Tax=Phytophthora cactorum TaxID=29920 RepID=A0A8T1UES5_9STRA|nr:hypothetical protein JG687_00008247 [Phytophthora cactorum]
MVNDAMGKVSMYRRCLVEHERKEILRFACRQFKDSNPSHDSVTAIIIDKDFMELPLLEEVLPGSKILICHFHAVTSARRGGKRYIQPRNMYQERMMKLIQLLVSATTETVYDKIIATMKVVLRSDKKKSQAPVRLL